MNKGEEYIVKIEKLTNSGVGLARISGFVVFVENVCPEDEVKIKITKVNKNYSYAEVLEIITPSVYRTKPFCPMQKVCGACQLQYINYDYQLEIKRKIIEDAMRNIGGFEIDVPDVVSSPDIKNFRHKVQYPVSQTKNSKRIIAGYYKSSSHEIINIKYCPIQPKICDEIIEYIKARAIDYGITGYTELIHGGDLRHIVLRCSSFNGDVLVTLVVNNSKISENIRNFANQLYKNFDQVCGVCINYNNKKTNVIMGKITECICGNSVIEEQILDKRFLVAAQTFFQVNPKSAENIFSYVKKYIKDNFSSPVILDAYAGISAFAIVMSDVANYVVSIEENLESVELAKKSLVINNIDNVEIHSGDAAKYFKQESRTFDVIILDPPRKGCSIQSLSESVRLCKNDGVIIYVSCNPTTLARDLKILKEMNCSIECIQPFDMFCHTYHVENVVIIRKN